MAIDRAFRQYRTGLVLSDAVVIGLAFVLAISARHARLAALNTAYLEAIPYGILITVLALRRFGAYSQLRGGFREIRQVSAGIVTGTGVLLALSFFYRGFSYSRLTVAIFVPLAIGLVIGARACYRSALDALLGNSRWLKRTLIVGSSKYAEELLRQLADHQGEYTVIGRLTSHALTGTSLDSGPIGNIPDLGSFDEIEEVIERIRPDLVILADPELEDAGYRRVIQACYERDTHWKVIPKVTTPPHQDISVTVLGGIALLGDRGNNITGFNFLLKRAVDVVASAFLLLLFSPLMLTVAALIKWFSPGPVLFAQERIGHRGRPFKFYKFRSMHVSNDDSIHRQYVKEYINGGATEQDVGDGTKIHKLTKDPRIIPFIGGFIRKYSVDELPQLLNVLKGDMSLVGPRPCLAYEAEYYRRWHKMRFDVLPGITGLWQVSGRNRLTFDQMVQLDIRYLQNWSLGLDLTIMAKTPYTILFDKAF